MDNPTCPVDSYADFDAFQLLLWLGVLIIFITTWWALILDKYYNMMSAMPFILIDIIVFRNTHVYQKRFYIWANSALLLTILIFECLWMRDRQFKLYYAVLFTLTVSFYLVLQYDSDYGMCNAQ